MTFTRVSIAVVLWEAQTLIGPRGPDGPLPGFWEFPGGKVERDETPAAAAERECLEETGLEVDVARELLRVAHRYEHGELELWFFACIPRQSAPAPREPFRWVNRSDLASYAFPPANAEVLEILRSDSLRDTSSWG